MRNIKELINVGSTNILYQCRYGVTRDFHVIDWLDKPHLVRHSILSATVKNDELAKV